MELYGQIGGRDSLKSRVITNFLSIYEFIPRFIWICHRVWLLFAKADLHGFI